MKETMIYKKIIETKKSQKNPIIESFKNQKKDYLRAIALTYLSATSFYFIFVFTPNFASNYLGISAAQAFGENSFLLFSKLMIVPIVGLIANRIGGLIITRISASAFIIFSIPLFYSLIHYKASFLIFSYIFSIMSALNAGSLPGLLVGILKPQTRCTIFSFSFNVGFGIFGGIMPFIGFFLASKFENPLAPVFYLSFSAIVTLLVSLSIKQGNQHSE